jgi:hypothetical protein
MKTSHMAQVLVPRVCLGLGLGLGLRIELEHKVGGSY